MRFLVPWGHLNPFLYLSHLESQVCDLEIIEDTITLEQTTHIKLNEQILLLSKNKS